MVVTRSSQACGSVAKVLGWGKPLSSDPSHASYWASLHNSCPLWTSASLLEPLG